MVKGCECLFLFFLYDHLMVVLLFPNTGFCYFVFFVVLKSSIKLSNTKWINGVNELGCIKKKGKKQQFIVKLGNLTLFLS